ncbi:MAG: hypothetical protein AABX28_02870 [Nanoarchaeota archaeon]
MDLRMYVNSLYERFFPPSAEEMQHRMDRDLIIRDRDLIDAANQRPLVYHEGDDLDPQENLGFIIQKNGMLLKGKGIDLLMNC